MSTSGGGTKDPKDLWEMFSSVLKNLQTATGAQNETIVKSLAKMLAMFPQILVATPKWPSTEELNLRRRSFSSALIRHLIHCQANMNLSLSHPGCLTVQQELLKSLLDHDPVRWREVLTQYLHLWSVVNNAAEQLYSTYSSQDESTSTISVPASATGVVCPIFPGVDEEHSVASLRIVDPMVAENIQIFLTKLIEKFLSGVVIFCPEELDRIQRICLDQVELGDPPLKTVSLQLLRKLHLVWGCGSLSTWNLEGAVLEACLEYMVEDDNQMTRGEGELLGKALGDILCCVSVNKLTDLDRDQSLLLSGHLVPIWKSFLKLGKLEKLGSLLREQLEEAVGALIQLPKVAEEFDVEETVTSLLDLVGWCDPLPKSIMVSLVASQLKEKVVGVDDQNCEVRQGKRKVDSDQSVQGLVVMKESGAWTRIATHLSAVLGNQPGNIGPSAQLCLFKETTGLARALLARLLGMGWSSVEIMDKAILTNITHLLLKLLQTSCEEEVFAGVIACLEDLLIVAGAWPGAGQFGSEISSLQQEWVAMVSLPWLAGQVKLADLRIADKFSRPLLDISAKFEAVTSHTMDKCLELLAWSPRDVAPKWRVEVYRLAWAARPRPLGVVRSLKSLVARVGPSSLGLVPEVVNVVLNKSSDTGEVEELASSSGDLVCGLARTAYLHLAAKEGEVVYRVSCSVCDGETPSKSNPININQVEPFLKLIGHSDSSVRISLLFLLGPWCVHIPLSTTAASLWLNYMDDVEYGIRQHFSKAVASLVEADDDLGSRDEVIKTVVRRVTDICGDVSMSSMQIQDTYISTLVTLAEVKLPKHSSQAVLDCLLDMFFKKKTNVAAYNRALNMLKDKMSDVTHKNYIVEWCAKQMCQISNPKVILNDLYLLCPSDLQTKEFINNNLHHLLPPVVLHSAVRNLEGPNSPLELIASYMGQKSRTLLMLNFPTLYPYLVVHASDQKHVKMCMDFLQKRSQQSIAYLLPTNRQLVLVELLILLSFSNARVKQALGMLAMQDATFKHPEKTKKEKLSSAVVAKYVAQGLMAVLSAFITRLQQGSQENKLRILTSLEELMRYLGPDNLTASKHSVLECLKLAGKLCKTSSAFQPISTQLWATFVRNIDMKSMTAILYQVLVGLLPHLDHSKDNILAIFRYLLVENQNEFKNLIPKLVFLPELPDLDEVNKLIQGGNPEFKVVIKRLIGSLDHESLDVRYQTLSRLSTFIDMNIGALQGLVLCSDRTDPIVTILIQKLMASLSSREPDKQIRMLAATCLGKIGAIDPGRLDLVVDFGCVNDDASANVLLDVTSTQFCIKLLNELVRAFLSSRDPFIVEVCSYSIQEVLKVYSIKGPSSVSSFGGKLWNQLSDSVQEILTPLLTSMYTRESRTPTQPIVPVYGSINGKSHEEWLVTWAGYLVTQVSDSQAKAIFSACMPAVKKDLRTAQFLLPYIVTYTLSGGSSVELDCVMQEVRAIINSSGDETSATKSQDGVNGSKHSSQHQRVAHSLFTVLDHMGAWLRTKFTVLMKATRKTESQLKPDDIKAALSRNREYERIKAFCDQIPHEDLANLSFNTGANHRSAFHMDQFLRLDGCKEDLRRYLTPLQRVYAALEEPDLVMGVAAMRKDEPTVEDVILEHESTGNYQDALCCYERQGKSEDTNYAGIISCYLSIDQPSSAAVLAAGLIAKLPDDKDLAKELAPLQVEAAWQLGQWEDLDRHVKFVEEEMGVVEFDDWQVGLGRVMLAAKRGTDLGKVIENEKLYVLEPLTAGSMEQGAYRRGFQQLTKLAVLYEIEKITEKFFATSDRDLRNSTCGAESLLAEFNARLNYTQYSWSNLEPMLRVRRSMFELAHQRLKGINSNIAERLQYEMGECWLRSAKVARKAGQLQEAYRLLLEVQKYKNVEGFLETAKLFWARGKQTQAIAALKKGLIDTFPDIVASQANVAPGTKVNPTLQKHLDGLKKEEREVCAKGKLLLARYVEEAANVSSDIVNKYFQEAKEICKHNEHVFFHQARSIDKQINKFSEEQFLNHGDLVVQMAIMYLRTLMLGPTYLYHSLPRLLSVWLDYASQVHDFSAVKNKDAQSLGILEMANRGLKKINQSMGQVIDRVPKYYFLTAFPQIVSRITHGHAETYSILKSIMVKVLVSFPQQAFWHMASVCKSKNNTRRSRCQEIFQAAINKNNDLAKFLSDAQKLATSIDELCDVKTEPRVKQVSLREIKKSLPALIHQSAFSPIILPSERNMVVTLPTIEGSKSTHDPYPAGQVFITGIHDECVVMQSLVAPKKITFKGSDGRDYPFLAKPKDDLRRDCRFMDYNFLLNKLFRKDPEARKRDLRIRTYSVVPTGETSGLIEWVGNLKGVRPILLQILKERGFLISSNWIKTTFPTRNDSVDKKREHLRKCIKEIGGSVLSEWFVRTFPDPQAWMMARLAFTRTTAVMSMVGYIVGLGDRHLENINVDETNGDTFHVDMNCLFNRGETMEVPEKVPFRLTHNMVDAFGPLGIEGPFRISCEVALSVMRRQKDVLLSVLRPFVFDPLVDWVNKDRHSNKGEEQSKPGLEAIKNIEDRLTGNVASGKKKSKTMVQHPLSVAGQVSHVIEEAMSEDNLCEMYWGWAPYL